MDLNVILSEISFRSTRSRGPGGQNVNKVASAAILKWDFLKSAGLTDSEKQTIKEKCQGNINKVDLLFLRCDEFRDLERNKAKCVEKLEELLGRALHRPRPRKATRPTKSSKLRAKETKQKHSLLKRSRQKVKE